MSNTGLKFSVLEVTTFPTQLIHSFLYFGTISRHWGVGYLELKTIYKFSCPVCLLKLGLVCKTYIKGICCPPVDLTQQDMNDSHMVYVTLI